MAEQSVYCPKCQKLVLPSNATWFCGWPVCPFPLPPETLEQILLEQSKRKLTR